MSSHKLGLVGPAEPGDIGTFVIDKEDNLVPIFQFFGEGFFIQVKVRVFDFAIVGRLDIRQTDRDQWFITFFNDARRKAVIGFGDFDRDSSAVADSHGTVDYSEECVHGGSVNVFIV